MKNIALIAIALLASAAFGEPSGPYMSYLGYDVGKSGSGEYSNYIGAYSGQYSTGISRCGFYGPASGQYGYKLYGCNGVGFYALANSEYMTNVFAVGTSAARDADHCEDCIYIGKDAGRNFSHRKGDVVIGDVLIHTNGVTTIKGMQVGNAIPMYRILPGGVREDIFTIDERGIVQRVNGWMEFIADPGNTDDVTIRTCRPENITFYNTNNNMGDRSKDRTLMDYFQNPEWWENENKTMQDYGITNGLSYCDIGVKVVGLKNGSVIISDTCGQIGFHSLMCGEECSAHANNSLALGSFSETKTGDDYSFVWSGSNSESIYVSHGTGTFNLNPDDGLDGIWVGEKTMRKHISDEIEKPRTSFTIEDEDTGEKYIIKVKSGALKLYKVEETEE